MSSSRTGGHRCPPHVQEATDEQFQGSRVKDDTPERHWGRPRAGRVLRMTHERDTSSTQELPSSTDPHNLVTLSDEWHHGAQISVTFDMQSAAGRPTGVSTLSLVPLAKYLLRFFPYCSIYQELPIPYRAWCGGSGCREGGSYHLQRTWMSRWEAPTVFFFFL